MGLPLVLYDNNSNLLTIYGVQNKITGAYINDATVAVTLKSKERANLGGETWPLAGSYVSGSNGNYQFVTTGSVVYPAGEQGFAVVTITKGSYTAEFEFECEFAVRDKASTP